MRTLAPSEALIMKCLWESHQDLTVLELTERLKNIYGKEYAVNTVSTFMTILMKKGFVNRYKKKHTHQYHPLISMDEYRQGHISDVKDEWYHGSTLGMMASLMQISDITPEEAKELRALLDEYSD